MRHPPYPFLLLFTSTTLALGADGPRPVAAWASGPLEARVAFDRPVGPGVAKALVGTRIVFGDDVKAGDRFVPRRPGDRPATDRGAESRGSLQIAGARLDDGGRTLVLATDPHSRDAEYALNLPSPIDASLAYGLRGVEVTRDGGDEESKPDWSGWWPSPDFVQAGRSLAGSASFEALARTLDRPGRLTLKALMALPKGKATVVVTASGPIEVGLGNESAKSAPDPKGGHRAEVAATVDADAIDLTIAVRLDGKSPFSLHVVADGRLLPPTKLTLPWAPPIPPSLSTPPVPAWVNQGGDPARGALLFKGAEAKCATCHKVGGEGGEVGPDLTELVHRDRAWVYRNMNEPSASIHPDYVPYTVIARDGRVLAGIVRAEGADSIKVVDTAAKATTLLKADVEELRPSATSIMPVGLLGPVGEQGTRDLIAFLTTPRTGKP